MNTAYRNAIASIESAGSGGYAALGPKTKTGDRAYGRYQVMGNNIPSWTKAALGKSLTPEQFLADPAAQDAVFDHRFGGYVAKYGPEKAARAWFGGEGSINKPGAKDVLGTNVTSYGNKFMAALGKQPSSATPVPAATSSVPAIATPPLVPTGNPADAVAAVFDSYSALRPPSYAAQLAAIQNTPQASVADNSDWWERDLLDAAAEDGANQARSQAMSAFFEEPEVPEIQIPEAIDQSINRYLARL